MTRTLMLVIGATLGAAAGAVGTLRAPVEPVPEPRMIADCRPPSPSEALAPQRPDGVLVQIFRGRATPRADREVSITTIFRERSFSVLTDAEAMIGSEEGLRERVRHLFSLAEVDSLGASLVDLPGGSAVLDDGGERVLVRLEGRPVGDHSVRLMVEASVAGEESVATSVIARHGRTVVLAGAAAGPGAADEVLRFICLTPL
ncbi:MAG TPA: hypothetical protein VJV23_01985 [Candidatus Polarisedimenticolia bacterium]|nr:hypothetical protein [Candidatus Polarisedimenticolia bacterium]